MMFTPRNRIEVHHFIPSEMEVVDTLYEICDTEFASRKDVHESFDKETSAAKWASQYLFREVRKVDVREDLVCSAHIVRIVSEELAKLWFSQKETV